MPKKLYRSSTQRMLCGVCGGLAEYFNIDVTLVRFLIIILGLSGYGIFIYIVGAVIMPDKNDDDSQMNQDNVE